MLTLLIIYLGIGMTISIIGMLELMKKGEFSSEDLPTFKEKLAYYMGLLMWIMIWPVPFIEGIMEGINKHE